MWTEGVVGGGRRLAGNQPQDATLSYSGAKDVVWHTSGRYASPRGER